MRRKGPAGLSRPEFISCILSFPEFLRAAYAARSIFHFSFFDIGEARIILHIAIASENAF